MGRMVLLAGINLTFYLFVLLGSGVFGFGYTRLITLIALW